MCIKPFYPDYNNNTYLLRKTEKKFKTNFKGLPTVSPEGFRRISIPVFFFQDA